MSIDITDIILISVCIVISIILMIFLNRNRFNCCYKKKENAWDVYAKQIHNNSIEDNLKLIKNIENQDKDLELL